MWWGVGEGTDISGAKLPLPVFKKEWCKQSTRAKDVTKPLEPCVEDATHIYIYIYMYIYVCIYIHVFFQFAARRAATVPAVDCFCAIWKDRTLCSSILVFQYNCCALCKASKTTTTKFPVHFDEFWVTRSWLWFACGGICLGFYAPFWAAGQDSRPFWELFSDEVRFLFSSGSNSPSVLGTILAF